MAKVIVAGLTAPLDIADMENQTVASKQQAKAMAMTLTNKLHESGYTTSYVSHYEIQNDNCTLFVVESRIAQIQIVPDTRVKAMLEKDLSVLKGTVYNKYTVYELISRVKQTYMLQSVTIDVVNYNDSSDVRLIIRVKAATFFYAFEIAIQPIYGVVPLLTVSEPLFKTIGTQQVQVGFNEERVTLTKASIEFMNHKSVCGWHVGSELYREYGQWERYNMPFTVTGLKPFLGMGSIFNIGVFDCALFLYGKFSYLKVSDHNAIALNIPEDITTKGCELSFKATDKVRSITKKNMSVAMSFFGGKSNEEYLCQSRLSVFLPLQVTHTLYIIPAGYSFYTNSKNRMHAEYVFDSYLLGYEARYTATQSRHIAGFECMYELIYEMLFCSVFTNAGLYKDEYGQWTNTANAGLSADLYYHSVTATAGCAWNIHEKFEQYYVFTALKSSW